MSRAAERALAALAQPGALLARDRGGASFGVFPDGDRRRRPLVKLSADAVGALLSEGAILAGAEAETFRLAAAGKARAAREAAPEAHPAFLAQHAPLRTRHVMDGAGRARPALQAGHDPTERLARLRDAAGAPFFAPEELAAARRLHQDWLAGQIGLTRGSDWSAPPRGSTPRAQNGAEAAISAGADARRRFDDALAPLAPPLRRVIARACLAEDGLEAIETGEGWPARSAKIALKLALAQLAVRYATS